MTNTNLQNVNPEQIQQFLPLFNQMPDSFWYVWVGLYTHFLGTGIGPEQASQQAMGAIALGLPVVKNLIGNINFGQGGGVQQTRVA
jgi:hypothetical protein